MSSAQDGEDPVPHTNASSSINEPMTPGGSGASNHPHGHEPTTESAAGHHTTTPPQKAHREQASSSPVRGEGVAAGSASPNGMALTPVEIVPGTNFGLPIDTLAEVIERRDSMAFQHKFGGVDGFLTMIKATSDGGIASASVAERREVLGENKLPQKPPVRFIDLLIDAFGDRVIQILCAAAVISIVFGVTLPDPHSGEVDRETGWIKGVAIVISVLVVTFTGAIQNYKKAKKFEELEAEQNVRMVDVVRDGARTTVETTELVVGDVLILETGMAMKCDGFLLAGSAGVQMNESPITGEPDLIEKHVDRDAFIVSGTSIEAGTGRIVVSAVGLNSFQGRLKQSLDEESGATPLQQHLEKLGDDIGKIGLAVALVMLIALSLKEVILITTDDKEANAAQFLNFVIIAVTLVAVAIPEGLPLAVTISLAFSMKAIQEEHCQVRILASCETMGAATAVCSDKTGTLTTNKMTVVQACLAEEEIVLSGYGIVPRKTNTTSPAVIECNRDDLLASVSLDADLLDHYVCDPLAVNSTADETTDVDGNLRWSGNITEIGILAFLRRLGRDHTVARKAANATPDSMKQFPFSSVKKHMLTIVRRGGVEAPLVAYVKGASETILESSDRYLDRNGHARPLTAEKRSEFEAIIDDAATQGNRTIGFGYAECPFEHFPAHEPEDLRFVFVGVLGIQDPIREEVPRAVQQCESAHLIVRMVTGDNVHTAMAISAKCGIFDEARGHVAMTGPEFRQLYRNDKEALVKKLPDLRVLARSSPNDKYVLVGLLQDELGDVVGVTGDGTNDAPALKLGNVGLAMVSGTDIAKGAADMVLLDDNFATIITAIKWGRAVNDNIKKFLQYQLAINFAGVGLTVIGSLASTSSKEPIAPVQLLWLNLIMDTLAALSLATELPEIRSLTRLPVYKQAPLITNHMRAFIAVHGGYQFTIVLLILFLGHRWFKVEEDTVGCENVGGRVNDDGYCQQGRVHSTILFNTFIWFQIFNVVNARKIYGEINCFEGLFSRSYVMCGVFALVIGLQVFAVEVGGDALATTSLRWDYWLICVSFGASELLIGLLLRLVPIHDYVPTKEQIIAAHLKEKEEAQKKETEEESAKQMSAPM